MQLEALPGQPVCKHSVSVCFGRAPAPRARSKLQQGRRGWAPAAAPDRAALDPGGWVEGCNGTPRRAPPTPSSLQQDQGSGPAQAGGSFTLRSIPSRILVATHGFSWLLGGPLGGCPGREAAWLGIPLAQVPLSCLLRAGPKRAAPPTGLLWSQRWVLLGFLSLLFSLGG